MIICSSGYYSNSFIAKYFRHLASIGDDLASICRKIWWKCFSKGNSLGEDSVFVWSSLYTRKNWSRKICCIFFFCHNHSSTRSSERLMCCCGNYITIWNWIFQNTPCNQSCNMSNISHQYSSNIISNFSKSFPIKWTRICWKSSNDEFWVVFFCKSFYNIHIDQFCCLVNSIWNNLEHFTWIIERMPMGKMSSMIKIHS